MFALHAYLIFRSTSGKDRTRDKYWDRILSVSYTYKGVPNCAATSNKSTPPARYRSLVSSMGKSFTQSKSWK